MALKRIISCILSIALLLSFCPVLAEEEEEKVIYGKEALGITNAIGITEYTEENLTEGITRGEFFKLACILAGYSGTVSSEIIYKDLIPGHEFEQYIKTLTKFGAIGGDPNGNILADENISLIEASAVILKIAGYSFAAESRGGFPSGYYLCAKLLKMYTSLDIDMKTALTKGMAAQLIFNSLEIPLIGQDTYGPDADYSLVEVGTFLDTVFHMKHLKDVVNGVDLTRLVGKNDINPFWIQVGELELECRGIENIYSYLGYLVDMYYVEERDKLPKVAYIQKSDDNVEITVDIDDIENISGTKLEYWDDAANKSKSYSFKNGAPVIYNGASTREALSMDMIKTSCTKNGITYTTKKHGAIRLIDNSKDGKYDVVFVDAYENFVVSHVDKNNQYIYDKYNPSRKLMVDVNANDPYTIVYDAKGEETDISEISANTVVSVYHSAADAYQQYVRIYILDGAVTGKIEQTRDDNEYVTIDGKEYRVNEECRIIEKEKLNLGNYVKAFTDVEGRISYLVYATETEYVYGFIVKAAPETKDLQNKLVFKMYDAGDNFTVFEAAENIILDGGTYKADSPLVLARLNEASKVMMGSVAPDDCYSSIVRYKLNANGEIIAIDTLIDGKKAIAAVRGDSTDNDDMLFMVNSGNSYYSRTYYTCGPQVAMKKETPVIMHPSITNPVGMNDTDSYMCGTAYDSLASGTLMTLNAFYTNTESMTADIISYPDGFVGADGSRIAVVKKVSKVWDDNYNDAVVCVTVVDNNGERKMKIKPGTTYSVTDSEGNTEQLSADTLKTGDAIRYYVNIKGYVERITLYYKQSTDTIVKSDTYNFYTSATIVVYGYVYDTFDDGYMIYVTNEKDRSVLQNVTHADCKFVTTRQEVGYYAKLMKFASGNLTVSGASFGDLKAYKDVGNECSRIAIQTYYGRAYGVYIIE